MRTAVTLHHGCRDCYVDVVVFYCCCLQTADIDPYDVVGFSFDKDKKKNADYETVKDLLDVKLGISKSGESDSASAAGQGLLESGTRAQPNVYSSLSAGKPAVSRAVLPTVTDLNSDYAEIIDVPESSVI